MNPLLSYVQIPDGSNNGITAMPALSAVYGYQSEWCGSVLGVSAQGLAMAITCKSFNMPNIDYIIL